MGTYVHANAAVTNKDNRMTGRPNMCPVGYAPECLALGLDVCGMPVNVAMRVPEGAESLVAAKPMSIYQIRWKPKYSLGKLPPAADASTTADLS